MADLQLNEVETKYFTKLWEAHNEGGQLGAGQAVVFLRESGLNDPTLHQVWALADAEGAGALDQKGFFTALKLVSLAQSGKDIDLAGLGDDSQLPEFGDSSQAMLKAVQDEIAATAAAAAAGGDSGSDSDWAVTEKEQAMYRQVFSTLEPDADGKITGKTARKVLVQSKLPNPVLGQIWELADMNQDGKLDFEEFAVAMHIVYSCIKGDTPPAKLPEKLIPPSKRGGAQANKAAAPKVVQPAKPAAAAPAPVAAAPEPTAAEPEPEPPKFSNSEEWVVSVNEQEKYEKFFSDADTDNDGFVAGKEIMQIFLSSELPKAALGHIWNLVDIYKNGKLNFEQFALAMHIISRKVKGIEIPKALVPEMVPPSCKGPEALPVKVPSQRGSEAAAPATAAAPSLPDRNYKQPAAAAPAAATGAGSAAGLEEAKAKKKATESALAAAKQELAAETQVVSQLQKEVVNQTNQIGSQETELAKVKKEVADLKVKETALRKEMKEGKQKLEALVNQIKAMKMEKSKIQNSMSRLGDSKAKIDASLKKFGKTVPQAKPKQNFDPFSSPKPKATGADPFAPKKGNQDAFTDYFRS